MDPRRYRKSRGLKLRDVAKEIGRSVATVSKHERGEMFPGPDVIDAYRRFSQGKVQFEDFEDLRRRVGPATETPPPAAKETDHAAT